MRKGTFIYAIGLALFVCSLRTETVQAQYISTAHVIPQVADGRAFDGSSYVSIFLVSKLDTTAATCTLNLVGSSLSNTRLTGNATLTLPVNIRSASWSTSGISPLATGYATVTCTARVEVNTLYVLNVGNEVRSMATVFSQGPFRSGSFYAFQNPPAGRLGIAVANSSNSTVAYQIIANVSGAIIGKDFTIGPQSSVSRFLDELLTLPEGYQDVVVYVNASQSVYATGLLFMQDKFTTIPITILP